ncbi:hypothetical protein [Kribbella shirazensis]|uniref:Uncharacterized protein n=1 Tax=Kribbella shirazensis TaxID=1105143 RepID=A0A7X6A3E6_9ACTN|nr:hypothetical protein [Kribbella shirazensis]NIK59254.1 hypothetical protein [Kribbella shirazensis]
MSEMMRSSGADGSDPGACRGKIRTVRSWCVYLATTAGLVCAWANWGLGGVIVSVAIFATATAVVATSVWGGDGRSALRRIARFTLAGGLIGPAAAGLIAVFTFAGVLVVLILAATTPALTSLVLARRQHARADDPHVAQPESATPRDPVISLADGPVLIPEPELRSLDDEALCLAWRRSFSVLAASRSAAERLSVVEQRQQYLDELQRRSPEGVAAWLASGARASGNPLPYVGDARRRAS